jgi:hypothetical protein
MNTDQLPEHNNFSLQDLIAIAERSMEHHDADALVRSARCDLFDACEICKAEMGISDYIQRGSDEWDTLSQKTTVERAALAKAKRVRYNAARRLQGAIRRYRAKGL